MTAIINSHSHSMHCRKKLPYSKGFTLVEFMVSIAIGMVIVAAMISLFIQVSSAQREMAKTSSQIENGRFVMQLMQNDISHAGYWSGFVPGFEDLTISVAPADVPSAAPDPCLAYGSWDAAYITNLIGIPVQAYDGVPTGCSMIAHKKANTDVLLVRHASTCVAGSSNCEADTGGKLYFQVSQCGSVDDDDDSDLDDGPGDSEIESGNLYTLGTSGFTLHNSDCSGCTAGVCTGGALADKRKYISNIYYIRDHSVTHGDGIPTLMLSSFDESGGTLAHQSAIPLIDGVEGFRVELGIDNLSDTGAAVDYTAGVNWADPDNRISPTNRGDGNPDTYVRCPSGGCSLANLRNVVSVKVFALVRTTQATVTHTDTKRYCLGTPNPDGTCPSTIELGPFNDGFKRHVFTTTVRLNNTSGRRETP